MTRLLTVLAVLAVIFPATTMAGTRMLRADSEVARWASPQRFSADFIKVEIRHNGKKLKGFGISRCKGHYGDRQIDVMVSTCGHRFRVKLAFVSFAGPERFHILYHPLRRP